MVLHVGNFPVPMRSAGMDNSRACAYCPCSGCGWVYLDIFLSSIIFLFFLPLSGRRPKID